MRVCIVSFQAYPLIDPSVRWSVGGAEVQLTNLARYLRQQGWEVDLVVRDHDQAPVVHHEGIRVIKSVSAEPGGSLPSRLMGFGRFWRALAKSDADVFLMSTASAHVGIGWLHSRLRRKRFVFRTAHEHDCNGVFEERTGWQGRLYASGLRGADLIITQNDDHRRILAQRGIRSRVIHNAFPIPNVTKQIERPIDGLWVGRCEPWKNPNLFIDVAERLSGFNFTMICPPADRQAELFDQVRTRASRLANLEFIEWIDYVDIQPYFDRAKVLIGTSEYEGFPNTYLQACMGGTPIATLTVNPDRFVTRNNLGFDAEGSFDHLCTGVKGLLDHPSDWAVKSVNAEKYVRQHHNIEVVGRKWLEALSC